MTDVLDTALAAVGTSEGAVLAWESRARPHLIQAGVAAGGRYIPESWGPVNDLDPQTQQIVAAKTDPVILTDRVLAAAALLDGPTPEVVVAAPSGYGTDRTGPLRNEVAHRLDAADPGDLIAEAFDAPDYRRMSPAARARSVEGRFSVKDPTVVAGRNVLLIDDVWATGAQLGAIRQALLDAGAAGVQIAVAAEAVQRHPNAGPLIAAGTSAGATKAWESRKKAAPATPGPAKVNLDSLHGIEQAFGALHGDLYDTEVIQTKPVSHDYSDDGSASAVRVKLLNKQGDKVGEAYRSIATIDGELVVDHESFDIDPKYQKQGIGAEFLRDSVAMYERAGVDHVATMAVSSPMGDVNGAYTWARLGFQLDPKYRDLLASKMTDKVTSPAFPDDADEGAFRDLAERVSTGKATIQDVAADPVGKDFLLGKYGLVSWHGILPIHRTQALAAAADTGDVDYDDWAAVESGLDPYDDDPLAAVGTSEGARRAWESRRHSQAPAPTLDAPAPTPEPPKPKNPPNLKTTLGVIQAFTFTDPKYSTLVDGNISGDGGHTVTSTIRDPDGKKIGKSHRMVSGDGKTVDHTSLYLNKNAQGKGIGGEYLRDSIAMYKQAGVEKITTTATSQISQGMNGAYTWAKLGFKLADKSRFKLAEKMRSVANSGQKWLGPTVRDSFTKLATQIETGGADIQDVMNHTIGKNFLLGKYGDVRWDGYIDVNDPALVAAAAPPIDYEAWAEIEQGLDPYGELETLTAAGEVELVDDETDRQAQAACRAAYRAAIELVAPRVLARIESGRATDRALTAAGDGDSDQIITDDEWAAIAAEHVDDAIGDGVLDGVVAGATQFLKLATQTSVAKAFAAAASSFAAFASQLRANIDTWIGNKIGQGITGDWGIGKVIQELGLDSPLSTDKADLVAGTETQAAVNAGTYAALQVASPAAIRWVTERDEKVRPAHAAADKDTVPFGEVFMVGGHEARYPGDPNLPPALRFNCRCHLAYVEGTEARRVVGATKAELRAKAAALSISGRSTMNKGQLQTAVLKDLCLQGLAGGPDCPDVLDQMNRNTLLAHARGEGIAGRYRMSREELVYQLRQSLRGGNEALVSKGYSTQAELARAKKKASYKAGRAKPGEFATSTVPSPAARRQSRQALFDEFGGATAGSVPCVHCGLRLGADASAGLAVLVPEPIIPWSQGGSLALKNLVPACPGCFRARGGTGLVSAGTSEGAKKAWETRDRPAGMLPAPKPYLHSGNVEEAFTMHGDKYDAKPGNMEEAYGALEVTVYLYDKQGKTIGVANRQVVEDGDEVHHDVLSINEDAQGKGIGAEYLRDSVEMYQRFGVKYVTVDATSDSNYGNGAYTWARLGFTPKDKEVDRIANRYKEAAGQKQKPPLDDDALQARIDFADDFRRGKVTIQDLSQDPIGKKLLLGDYGDITWEGYIDVAKGLTAAAGPVDTATIDYDEWADAEYEQAGGADLEALTAAGTSGGAKKAWDARGRGEEVVSADEFGRRVPSKRDSAPKEWFGSPAELAATRALIARKVAENPKPTRAEIAKNRRMLRRAETHGRAGGELRGNSTTRRLRGEALFNEFGGARKGYCLCGYCGLKVSPRGRGGHASMQQDKILTAAEGGKYGTPTSFPNLIPACTGCNASRNDAPYQLAAAADVIESSNNHIIAAGTEVVAFPLGWDDPDMDTLDRPVQGVLERRTVTLDGRSYVQWLAGGEVIDPDTIILPDGTLTAAGTSEGARRAWESRQRAKGPAIGSVSNGLNKEMLGRAVDGVMRRRMDRDVASGTGPLAQAVARADRGGTLDANDQLLVDLYHGDPAARTKMIRRLTKQHDELAPSENPEQQAMVAAAAKALDDNPAMRAAVDRFGPVEMVTVKSLGSAAASFLSNYIAVGPFATAGQGLTRPFKPGGLSVDESTTGTLRHEYGHYVSSTLSDADKKAWIDAHHEWGHGNLGPEAMMKAAVADGPPAGGGVSVYARTNSEEAFGETFSLVTHPDFDYAKVDPAARPLVDTMRRIIGRTP